MESLQSRFERYIAENSLLDKGDKILVAVSGGVDSMVMLSLFVAAGYDVAVAHCNFQLRGQESDEDDVMVADQAERYGVKCHAVRFDTAGEMERTGESVQVAARRLRYEWFARLSRENGYTAVAIAHHADDSVETFFINLLRGTGLRGLTGISNINGRVVRPMLFATRKDILDYASANKVSFREDSSNRSTKYLRNKIRLGLVPRIKEINPRFADVMGGNIQRLTDSQLFIGHAVELIRQRVETQQDGIITIDPAQIDPGFPVHFVIYELLALYGFKGSVVDKLCEALEVGNTGRRFYSKEYVAYVDRGRIVLAAISQEDACEVMISKDTDRVYCGNSALYMEVVDIDNVETLIVPEHVALLDADKLQFPLRARRWNEGDWFVPLGMEGRKKVSDFLIDAKVSVAEKGRQFVVLSGEDVVWLAGRRIDDRYKISKQTENVLRIVKEVI